MTSPLWGSSGTEPDRALEAINRRPRAQRENPILPRVSLRAPDRSRGASTATRL